MSEYLLRVPIARALRAALLLAIAAALLPHATSAQAVTLSDAAALALRRHPSVVAAEARAQAAGAATGVARAAWLPSVRTEASAVRFQEPMIVQPLHRFDPNAVPAFDRTLIQGNVAAAWTVFDGGARGARIRQADALHDASVAGHRAAEATLVAATARAWLDARLAVEVLAAFAAEQTALTQERRRVAQLLEEGKVPRVELLRIDAALARTQADAAAAAANRDVALADLARHTGAPVEPASVSPRLPAGVPELTLLRAQALDASEELRAARARAAAADAARAESRAAFLPRLDLGARYNEYGSGAGDFAWEWQGGVQVSWPVFTGGARARQSERASAEARAAAADAEAIALDVTHAVDRAVAALTGALARAGALEAALEQQQEVVRVELLALDAGAGVQTDYLAAEAELRRTRAALTEARHAAIAARIELARITGELSPAWLANTLEQGQ